ncbi:MAG TPA: response regulator transcription factor [Anaerolineales bacterium]|jgi:two-component system KDP operon response regulator KdpE|nr:response regulator transcription factor [Anaerolineales bacterium]
MTKDQNYKTLVVDDDPKIRKLIHVNLEPRGYIVQEAADGSEAIKAIQDDLPDLMLLDLVMPGLDGIEVCQWVRERSDLPIIVLSARDEEELKVRALDAGADDYVPKPFGYEELLARVRAVMRRTAGLQTVRSKISIDSLVIDLKARRVTVDGQPAHLTRTEFALLAELAQNLDSVLTHKELLSRVWGPEYYDASQYLHVYFGRIRSKIGPKYSALLETVPGMGYSLHAESGNR